MLTNTAKAIVVTAIIGAGAAIQLLSKTESSAFLIAVIASVIVFTYGDDDEDNDRDNAKKCRGCDDAPYDCTCNDR